MKTVLMILLLGLGLTIKSDDVSMLGLQIGSSSKEIDNIKLKIIAEDNPNESILIKKFRTNNGNDFSVTAVNGMVVYLENDWLHQADGTEPLITNFTFGETTLKEIRQTFGSNGFAYVKFFGTTTETDIIMLNCFEIDSPNDEILVVVTKLPLSIAKTYKTNNVTDHLKLEALILSNSEYLGAIWGDEKTYDDGYKKIKL